MAEQSLGGYREKYVQALKEQERIEKQHQFQLELLRKTLFKVAGAASGMDAKLDSSVKRLKGTMRGGNGAQVLEQMELVGAAVQQFEQQRILEQTKAVNALKQLITQYRALQLSKPIKRSLKSFSDDLAKRLKDYHQYPSVLHELAKLQQLALESATNPSPNLWQRLKGGQTLNTAHDPSGPESDARQREGGAGEEQHELAIDLEEVVPSLEQEEVCIGQASARPNIVDDEESYEGVAKRIAATLANLIENIEPNELIKHRVDIVRHRIARGMDWYVLAVTLEDIRDILFLRYLQADDELSDYLNQVRSELGSIRASIAGAVEGNEAQSKASTHFSEQVSSGVDRIRASVEKDQSVSELKEDVTEHINFISDALQHFNERPQSSLTEQLEQLMGQVKRVESESKKTKEALEEQRRKATHDSLTGVPNREAYIERAFQEVQRFKRYKHPLSIAVCDIDFFKKINDGYGHQVGDKVLKLIANLMTKRLRSVDFIARYGGEEFVILLPETTAEQAYKVLDKIRAVIGKSAFRFKENPVNITVSFGIAQFKEGNEVEDAFERADKALYKAKNQGRNQCIIAE